MSGPIISSEILYTGLMQLFIIIFLSTLAQYFQCGCRIMLETVGGIGERGGRSLFYELDHLEEK